MHQMHQMHTPRCTKPPHWVLHSSMSCACHVFEGWRQGKAATGGQSAPGEERPPTSCQQSKLGFPEALCWFGLLSLFQ